MDGRRRLRGSRGHGDPISNDQLRSGEIKRRKSEIYLDEKVKGGRRSKEGEKRIMIDKERSRCGGSRGDEVLLP